MSPTSKVTNHCLYRQLNIFLGFFLFCKMVLLLLGVHNQTFIIGGACTFGYSLCFWFPHKLTPIFSIMTMTIISFFSFQGDLCFSIMIRTSILLLQLTSVLQPSEEFELTTNSLGALIGTHGGLIFRTLS